MHRSTTILLMVMVSAVLQTTRARAGYYDYCEDCVPCPVVDVYTPIEATPNPRNPKDPSSGYKRECKRDQNPAGSENWEPWQWAGNLGFSVTGLSDWDRITEIHVYERDCDFDCPCELKHVFLDPPWINGSALSVVWSGGPVDLTTVGTYTLFATVLEPPYTPPPGDCPCPGTIADDPLVLCFTLEVYSGHWEVSPLPEDQPRDGILYAPSPVLTYDALPLGTAIAEQGFFLEAGGGDVKTLVENTFLNELHTGDVWVWTQRTSVWRKVYRWVDDTGHISDCPADPKTFKYEVNVQGSARVKGIAPCGAVTSNASLTVTVSLPEGDDPRQFGGDTATLAAQGHAEATPAYSWAISFKGPQVGSGSGAGNSYASGAIPATAVFTGSVKGGGNTKRVACEVTMTGMSESHLSDHAMYTEGQSTLSAPPTFEPASE